MVKKELYLIIHNVRSALNVGSMLRTADAAGVNKVYICGYSPVPESTTHDRQPTVETKSQKQIAKTALGAEKSVAWEKYHQTWRLLKDLKKNGVLIVGLEQSADSIDYNKFTWPKGRSVALIVGNEVRGLSEKILKICGSVIEIPMRGKKESLNVSVATGVALYGLLYKNRPAPLK